MATEPTPPLQGMPFAAQVSVGFLAMLALPLGGAALVASLTDSLAATLWTLAAVALVLLVLGLRLVRRYRAFCLGMISAALLAVSTAVAYYVRSLLLG